MIDDWWNWLRVFLAEYKLQAGYELSPDDLFEERLREDYFNQGITPEDAVTKEIERDD